MAGVCRGGKSGPIWLAMVLAAVLALGWGSAVVAADEAISIDGRERVGLTSFRMLRDPSRALGIAEARDAPYGPAEALSQDYSLGITSDALWLANRDPGDGGRRRAASPDAGCAQFRPAGGPGILGGRHRTPLTVIAMAAQNLDEAGADPGVVVITGGPRGGSHPRPDHQGRPLYLVKPVDLRKLEAAILSVMRRRNETMPGERPWRLDPVRRRLLTPAGDAVNLTEAELLFLSAFFGLPGSTVDRASLAERFDGEPRGLDLLVHRLRRKVENEAGAALPPRTVHGRGYIFAALTAM